MKKEDTIFIDCSYFSSYKHNNIMFSQGGVEGRLLLINRIINICKKYIIKNIVIVNGPGSFSGLRGIFSFIKGFFFNVDINIYCFGIDDLLLELIDDNDMVLIYSDCKYPYVFFKNQNKIISFIGSLDKLSLKILEHKPEKFFLINRGLNINNIINNHKNIILHPLKYNIDIIESFITNNINKDGFLKKPEYIDVKYIDYI
jgi:tRNA A37 threonylcarbamoyladenosine modification protein TsaB